MCQSKSAGGGGKKNKKNICAAAQSNLQVCVWSRQEGWSTNMWCRRFSLASASWPKFWLSHHFFFFPSPSLLAISSCRRGHVLILSLFRPERVPFSHHWGFTQTSLFACPMWYLQLRFYSTFSKWKEKEQYKKDVQNFIGARTNLGANRKNTNVQRCGSVMWNSSDTVALSRSTQTKILWEF